MAYIKRIICKFLDAICAYGWQWEFYHIWKTIGYRCFDVEYISHAQNLEDVILSKICPEGRFYIDIGAHHPTRFSNTFLLHSLGWHGINIDPRPDIMQLFAKSRTEDINLEMAVSDEKGRMEYYMFAEPAYNTISVERANLVIKNNWSQLLQKKEIDVVPLSDICEEYLPYERKIDVLTLDVETMEMHVLLSNNWIKYRPKVIVMESLVNSEASIFDIRHDEAVTYLLKQNYRCIGKVTNAVFFVDDFVQAQS